MTYDKTKEDEIKKKFQFYELFKIKKIIKRAWTKSKEKKK
jgi:hypothetical protein